MNFQTDTSLHREVEAFLFREARLQDTHQYDAWEQLWTEDAIYWVPANGLDGDPDQVMSVIYDNRSRIGIRIAQLNTGRRHTQEPRSNLVRIVSNVEIVSVEGDEMSVHSNSLVYEDSLRGETIWACRNEFRLRRAEDGLRMVKKKVGLVNNHKPINTLSFLI